MSPPVSGVEDEDICADHLLQHGRELVQLESPGSILLSFELYKERVPEEFHGAIVIHGAEDPVLGADVEIGRAHV